MTVPMPSSAATQMITSRLAFARSLSVATARPASASPPSSFSVRSSARLLSAAIARAQARSGASLGIVPEHVPGGAGGREKKHVSLRMPCPEPVHGFLKRRLTRHGNARSGKRLLDQGRVAPDEGDGASRAFQGFDQRREILPLAVSAENDEDAAALSCEALNAAATAPTLVPFESS